MSDFPKYVASLKGAYARRIVGTATGAQIPVKGGMYYLDDMPGGGIEITWKADGMEPVCLPHAMDTDTAFTIAAVHRLLSDMMEGDSDAEDNLRT